MTGPWQCHDCGERFREDMEQNTPAECPYCGSDELMPLEEDTRE